MKKLIFTPPQGSFFPIFILLPLVLAIGFISLQLFDFLFLQPDTAGYLNAIQTLADISAEPDCLHRLSKPLVLFFPSLLLRFFQIDAATGLFLQQLLSYSACGYLIYFISKRLFPEANLSQHLAMPLALLLCQPMAIYGLALMTDASAWAIELFAIYLILSYASNKKSYPSLAQWKLGLLLGVGFFVKETVFIAGFFLFCLILSSASSWSVKIYTLIKIGLGFIIPVVIGSLLTQYFLQTSMLAWWQFAHEDANMYQLDLKNYILQIFRTLDVFWFFVPIGIYQTFKNEQLKAQGILKILLLAGLLAFIIFPFVWSYRSDRILFMIALLFLPFVALGSRFFGPFGIILILLGGSINLFMTYRIYRFEEGGWILWMSCIFLLLLLLALLGKKYLLKAESP